MIDPTFTINIWLDNIEQPVKSFTIADFGGVIPDIGDSILLMFCEEKGDGDYFRIINRQVNPWSKQWHLHVEAISDVGFKYKSDLYKKHQ